MFCPQCGLTQPDELNYCKACGANLSAVRTALAPGTGDGKFDWNKTWLAEMLQSSEESTRRAAKIERLKGKTPDIKRRNEIKAGVITASAGMGLMIVVISVMEGIIASGLVSPGAVAILSRVWVAGFIPIFVGLALIVNGVFISKKGDGRTIDTDDIEEPEFIAPAQTNQLGAGVPFSVTDDTTRNLDNVPAKKRKTSEIS